MERRGKWAVGLGVTIAALGAAWLAAAWWLPSDEDLARFVAAQAEKKLGVKVDIGSAHWALLPKPRVVINDFRTRQPQPVVIRQLSAHPSLRGLLQRKLAFTRVDIDEAVFPRDAVRAFRGKLDAAEPDAGDSVPVQHFAFRNLTWIAYGGIAVVFEGEIDFDSHWRPRHAELRRPGVKPAFTLTLTREADADRWQTRIHVGGGTAHGYTELKTAANGVMHLSGQLTPQDIEVESAVSTFNRRSPVAGKASGQTLLSANGDTAGDLVRSLHTRTAFSVNPAAVLRFDLDKALRTLGKERDGQTHLQILTGQLDTQNTDQGMRATYTALKARAGQYSANGEATVYRRQIAASGVLYLAEGAVGMPFTVSGPVSQPKASTPPGAFAGAAIGTAVLPGIGTVIGARIGGTLGKLFKGDTQAPAAPTPGGQKKN